MTKIINLTLTVVLIVGGYQFYFLPQRCPGRKPIEIITKFEKRIPFYPSWVWVYSGLYYPTIIGLVFTIDDFKKFNFTAFNFLVLLFIQLIISYLIPVKAPDEWRQYQTRETLSTKFLSLVRQYDKHPVNCFPSMHVSVATLTALHLDSNLFMYIRNWSSISLIFPILIGISTLFTKQHYLIDIIAGALLGYIVFGFYS
jgi:membrane-associated phospholipid phosphatase